MSFDVCVLTASQCGMEFRRGGNESHGFLPRYRVRGPLTPSSRASVIGSSFFIYEAVNALRLREAELDHAVLGHGFRHSEFLRKLFYDTHDIFRRLVPAGIIVKLLDIVSSRVLRH